MQIPTAMDDLVTGVRVVSPSLNELEKLRTPLTAGERQVLNIFLKGLPPAWEIYVQPFLNGLRPDFVLLNPGVGVAVYEVKDWILKSQPSKWETGADGRPMLWRKSPQGKWYREIDPVAKARLYSQEILELYCPRLGASFKYTRYSPVVTTGLIFPEATNAEVREYFAPALYHQGVHGNAARYFPVVGKDDLRSSDILRILPEARRGDSQYMSASLAQDLRHWLVEPDHSKTQREPLMLDKRQRDLTMTRTETGYRRIKGAAGSGKSVVLASRAARLAREGKRVLVVSFNITLVNYLGDLASRALLPEHGSYRNAIEWNNFHGWCKVTCERLGYGDRYNALFAGGSDHKHVLDEAMAKLVSWMFSPEGGGQSPEYDAVLIDEGQDYRLSWWSALLAACEPGGEKVLVADATQDLYETAGTWTEERMLGAGFSGQWTKLEACYRLPVGYIEHIKRFAETFLPLLDRQIPVAPDGELEFAPLHMKWIQVGEENPVDLCVAGVLDMPLFSQTETLSYSDVVFITDRNDTGLEVAKRLASNGVKVAHTYDPDERKARKQKRAFFLGRESVKATTIHSFKGWEAKLLVLHVHRASSSKDRAALYAGLTRLKRTEHGGSYITVICSDPELSGYGQTWPEYEEVHKDHKQPMDSLKIIE